MAGDEGRHLEPRPSRMRAWEVAGAPGRRERVRLAEREVPSPGGGEVLVQVEVCGVCRTDLHVADGDLPVHRTAVVPGHEVVGHVVEVGRGPTRFDVGDRVGLAWLRGTCGACRWCRAGRENLCPDATFTGWDADGGYAEYVVAPAAYAYSLPAELPSEQAAPLLCAGIIGYRSLRRAALPPGGRLGIYGFGASAHLTAQIAVAEGAEVHVLTRGEAARGLALSLGVASVGARTTRRRHRWTPPSCSRPPASSCRSRWTRCAPAAPSRPARSRLVPRDEPTHRSRRSPGGRDRATPNASGSGSR